MRLPSLSLDMFSFVIGFVGGTLFWFLIDRMRPLIKQIREDMKAQREAAQARRTSNVEENHRRATLRRAQGMHLAAPLFALDEILQPPLLIAPPPIQEPGAPPISQDLISQTLPYLPSWPEMAAFYNTATLTIPEALSGGRNLVITGQPGLGKSVALAHLASLCANRNPSLSDNLSDKVPFLLHVADLNLPVKDAKKILDPITDAVSENAPLLDLARLPEFVQYNFQSGRALLLLDGFDELAPDGQETVTSFIETLLAQYPKIQVVATGCPEHLDGLIRLNFIPLALRAWGPAQQDTFLQKWADLWTRYVTTETWTQDGPEPIDPILLTCWLKPDNLGLTPFELTLKVWGAYAGDSLGPQPLDAINTHLRRIAPSNVPVAALEMLGMQVTMAAAPIFDSHKAREWVKSFEPPEELPVEDDAESADEKKGKDEAAKAPAPGLLPKMADSGLLVSHINNRMRFIHPIIGGYLAGRGLSGYNAGQALASQPAWSGKHLALRYLSCFADISSLVDEITSDADLPLQRPLLTAGRWLRHAPRQAPWRGKVMGSLAGLLQTEGLPLGLRGQAMAAFALSNDPSAATFFRQAMQSNSFELVQLAALGAGVARDEKAIPQLNNVLQAPSSGAKRAACMALVAIGSDAALETVADGLLHGDEDVQRAAAEALADHPGEGHSMLREGATMEDILVRRAVVYGLGRVNEPWALELLQSIQVEDDQWIVRNAATEVIDNLSLPDISIQRKLPPPSESPWLIEFASTQGMGISPGSPATEVLLQAYQSDDEEIRLAALAYLRQTPSEGILRAMYQAMYSDDPELRESTFQVLSELAAGGLELPHPNQFGVG